MKTKIANKIFPFFILLCASFFSGCSNGIIEPSLVETRTVMGQYSINMSVLSEMSEEESVEFIIENGVTIPNWVHL